ncbi:MAG: RHS repeat-associated core domain-containing protein, partial [Bacteroidota bacterium]
RLTSSTITRSSPTHTASRSSSFTYSDVGILTKEVLEPGNELQFEKEYTHDKYGNVLTSVSRGSGKERTHQTKYDDKGRFVIENINALNHKETVIREPYFGQINSVTGPNELTTYFKYDGFGRKVSEILPDGNTTRYVYRKSEGSEVSNSVYYLYTETSGIPPSISYYDVLDRVIRTQSTGFNDQEIKVDVHYNNEGQILQESDPYSETAHWTTYEYDAINRPIKITSPGGRESSVSYNGLMTQSTNPKGQNSTQLEDVVGRLSEVLDHYGSSLSFQYDAFGNIIGTTDNEGNTISSEYDIRGNRTKLVDPDLGTFLYTYNAFGELLSQTYPEGNEVALSYDILSRLTQRVEAEGTTNWSYDTEFIGSLTAVTTDGYEKKIEYDEYGRPTTETLALGDDTYETSNGYDALGRIQRVEYPSGLAVVNDYNDAGFIDEVRNENGHIYWQAETYNDRGQCTNQKYGNDLDVLKTYDDETGYLEEILVPNIQGSLQHLKMTYDQIGNITSRSDEALANPLTEHFEYDDLNRLTSSTIGATSVTLKYDAIGNITFKSDVGSYTYGDGGAGPHAVTTISSTNCPSFQIEEIDYYSFQKVREITKDSVKLNYKYAPNRLRYRSVIQVNDSVTQTKTYVGNLYEKIQEGDSLKEQHYIHTPEGVVAIETIFNEDNTKSNIRYLHKDHLGSIQTITDENGLVQEVLSFDAWGKLRDATTWEALDTNPETLFDRGFTMHEYMSLFTLINQNGRIYDPIIGRFISADPFIDGATDLQGYNRYSYVRNNPLTLIDPSGYGWFSKVWKSIKKAAKKVVGAVKKTVKAVGDFIDKHKVTIASIGIGIITGGIGGFIGSAIGGSILGVSAGVIGSAVGFGFGSSTSGALLSGASLGDALKAGLKQGIISGVVATATFGLGQKFGRTTWDNIGRKIASHGVVQGTAEVAQGGKFEHGFLAGASGVISGFATGDIDSFIGRTAIAATVGGTVSVVGGGKFANGAQSAAFVVMYNEMSDKLSEFMFQMKVLQDINDARSSLNRMPDFNAADVVPGQNFTDHSNQLWEAMPWYKNIFH